MLSKDEVVRLAGEEGLGAHAARLLERIKPGWRLEVDSELTPSKPGVSKIGGHPDLAQDEVWPTNRRGIAMVFLAQIAASTLPPPNPGWEDRHRWAHRGRLIRVFADLLDSPFDPGPAVVLACDPRLPLARTEAPPVPNPWPPGGDWDNLDLEDRFHVLPEAAVRPVPFLTAPETDPAFKPGEWDSHESADRYESFAMRLRVDGGDTLPAHELLDRGDYDGPLPPAAWELHHLLGEACSIQEDVRTTGAMFAEEPDWQERTGIALSAELKSPEAWRVLLALHSDERIGLQIADGGAFHVLAPVADLEAGCYERVVCANDSG